MFLVTYPISELTNQMIGHPDETFKHIDTSNKEESKMALMMLIAQFGTDTLSFYDMSSTSQSSYFDNIRNFFDDVNHESIDFENRWCLLLNLDEDDIRSVLVGYKRDFIIVDANTKKPRLFKEGDKLTMVVYGNFELAINDANENDKLYCLLSVKDTDNENVCDVHIFSMEFENVKEVGTFKTKNEDREWFINSYDEVCKLSAPKKKMYLLQCRYANGNHFEEDIYNRLFESQEIAKEELCKEVKNVEEEFKRLFGDEWQFEWSKNGLCCCIDFNCYEDYWEGYVEELKVN